jgi:trans-2-enoyl-CoA reductase
MSLLKVVGGKWRKYWIDDESRDDFFFRRRTLIAFCILGPISTINEVYQGTLRVCKFNSLDNSLIGS